MAKEPSSLKGWLKFSALPLNTDSKDKYKQLIISGKLGEELVKAYQHVKSLPAMVPAGITCGIRKFADVQKLVADNEESMFSGSLSQLSVDDRALATIDFGRIGHVIESADTDLQLKSILGVITINIPEGKQQPFMRANKDAEVDALCLLMFWHSSNSQVLERLIAVASDLVFVGRRLVCQPLRHMLRQSADLKGTKWMKRPLKYRSGCIQPLEYVKIDKTDEVPKRLQVRVSADLS